MENMDECQSTPVVWCTYELVLFIIFVSIHKPRDLSTICTYMYSRTPRGSRSATRAASYENSISNWRMVLSSSSLRVTKKTTQQSNAFIYNGDGIGEKHNDDDVVETMITSSTCGDGGAGMHIDLSLRRTAF